MKKVGFGGFAGLVLMGLGFSFSFWATGHYFLDKPGGVDVQQACKAELDMKMMAALGDEFSDPESTKTEEERIAALKRVEKEFQATEKINKCVSELTKAIEEDDVRIKKEMNKGNLLNLGAGIMLFLSGLMIFLAFREDKK